MSAPFVGYADYHSVHGCNILGRSNLLSGSGGSCRCGECCTAKPFTCVNCGQSFHDDSLVSVKHPGHKNWCDHYQADPKNEDDESSSDTNEEETEEQELELKLDQNGRVLADTVPLNFHFRSFSSIVDLQSQATLATLRNELSIASTKNRATKDESSDDDDDSSDDDDDSSGNDNKDTNTTNTANTTNDTEDDSDGDDDENENDYSEGQTFWVAANSTPTTTLERMALDIFQFHAKGCQLFDPATSGAEWWTLAIDSDNSDVAWHWDKDYGLEDSGVNLSPHLATVTYLSNNGSPTVMLNKTTPTGYTEDFSGTADQIFISRPKIGKHISFDGRFLHSAPLELSLWPNQVKGETRYSFLVNIWLNWKPQDTIVCPNGLLNKLGEKKVDLDFSQESKIKVMKCGKDKKSQKTWVNKNTMVYNWDFAMGEQEATIKMTVPQDKAIKKYMLRDEDDKDTTVNMTTSGIRNTSEDNCDGSLLIVENDISFMPLVVVETKQSKRGVKRKKGAEEAHTSSSSSSSSINSTAVKIKQEVEVEINIPGLVDPSTIGNKKVKVEVDAEVLF